MATTARSSSFLPSIKCSNCSVEIPISQMGDHSCAEVPSLPKSQVKTVDAFFAPPAPPPQNPLPLPPIRKPLPWSEENTSNNARDSKIPVTHRNSKQSEKSIPPNPPFTFPGSFSSSRSASPIMPAAGQNNRFRMPPRSKTTPLSPPSPDLSVSQDCAFPPFPSSKSRSPTPTTPVERTAFFPLEKSSRGTNDWESTHAPRSPGSWGGGAVLKRLDSITPGPFNMKAKGEKWKPGHAKSPSMSKSQDFTSTRSSVSSRSHITRLSTSSSNYTRNRSMSSASGVSRTFLDLTDAPAIPSLPVAPTTSDQSAPVSNGSETTPTPFDFGNFSLDRRSNTFPQDSSATSDESQKDASRNRPSNSSVYSHKPRPSVAAAMQPLNDIGSTKSFKSSRSLRGRPPPKATEKSAPADISEPTVRSDSRLDDAPPVPKPMETRPPEAMNPYHTPHESTSSNESYGSGFKGGSSRSSPPLDMSPERSHGHDFSNKSVDNSFEGFNFDCDSKSQQEEPALLEPLPQVSQTIEPAKSAPSHPDVAPLKVQSDIPSSTPRDIPPRKDSNTVTSPDDYTFSSSTPKSNNLRLTPVPPHPAPPMQTSPNRTPPARKPTLAHKGKCRGCNELIVGKSVSSADGRLTGRYHKACFVCKTCSSPFPSAEFYITNNHPYCGRHYHELNHSLCTRCDRGIEGQYLETEDRRKFHSHCFSCQECHRILRDDYYEWNGKALCEQHAFRAAGQGQSSLLGPGRRFPERRTTKLMMMM